MTQKKKSSIDFDCMEVTEVKVNKFKSLPGANRIKGVAEIVLNGQLILRGLRIIESSMGLYVGYPIDPFFKGEDLCCGLQSYVQCGMCQRVPLLQDS